MSTDQSAAVTPLYKVLYDGRSPHTGFEWSLPKRGKPGKWHEVQGPIVPHENGFYLTSNPRLHARSRTMEVYLVETQGEVQSHDGDDEHVARKVRLLRRLTTTELDALDVAIQRLWRGGGGHVRKYAPEGTSPAQALLIYVWKRALRGSKKKSWLNLNQAMSKAYLLTVSAGMEFADDDILALYSETGAAHWMGDVEICYEHAVRAQHTTACKAWEKYLKREPLLFDGARLHVDAELPWLGLTCKVTSFTDDGIIACAYHPVKFNDHGFRDGPAKVAKRFRLSREEVSAYAARRKRAKAREAAATKLSEALSAVGVPTPRRGSLIVLWTEAERDAAAEWAQAALQDLGKTRVRPPEMPEFVRAAAGASNAAVRDAESTLLAWAASNLEGEPADYIQQKTARVA